MLSISGSEIGGRLGGGYSAAIEGEVSLEYDQTHKVWKHKGKAKASRDSVSDDPSMVVIAETVEHFAGPVLGLLDQRIFTLKLNGTVPYPDKTVSTQTPLTRLTSTLSVHFNQKGTAWWPLGSLPCQSLPMPLNCLDDHIELSYDGYNPYVFTLTRLMHPTRPGLPTLWPAPLPVEVFRNLWPGYDYTLRHVTRAEASPLESLEREIDFAHSASFHVDATAPGVHVLSDTSFGHADPGRHRPRVEIRSFTATPASLPEGTMQSSSGFKLLGGGALLDSRGVGNIMTASYPVERNGRVAWTVAGKDHLTADPATLTIYGFGLREPDIFDQEKYRLVVATGQSTAAGGDVPTIVRPVSRPSARATVPPGYVLVSGGCRVDWKRGALPGNLLTGSYPDEMTKQSWICESKDQGRYSPATITAYAVGISPIERNGVRLAPTPVVRITKMSSPGAAVSPSAKANLMATGFVITGCGARAEVPRAEPALWPIGTPSSPGQLLTAIFPVTAIPTAMTSNGTAAIGCEARSTGHVEGTPGTVTAYAVNVLFDEPTLHSRDAIEVSPGQQIELTGERFVEGMRVRFETPNGTFDVPAATNRSVYRLTTTVPTGLTRGDGLVRLLVGDVVSQSRVGFLVR